MMATTHLTLTLLFFSDEREERLDNQSETASLMSSTHPTNHQAINSYSRPKRSAARRGWLSRLLNQEDRRVPYEPIADVED
jgi:hypothetical protein